jgi:hypothetical protein
VQLYLNELSLTPPAPDRTTARAGLLALQETIQAAVRRGLPSVLCIHKNFWEVQIADGYSVVDWLADRTIEREQRQQLRNAVSKAPFLEALHEKAENDRGGLAEARWKGLPGLGMGLAAMVGSPVVSLPAPDFCVDPLPVVVRYVRDEDETATNEDLCNLYSPAVVERRGPWIAQRQQQELPSGAEVLRLRAELLERLDFTDSAIDQLGTLTGNEKTFPFVVRHLFALNQRARDWDGTTPFSEGYPFGCSDESSSTLAMYSEARTFRCPDGERRVFGWHSKINYEKWRIHFIDSPATRRVLIGYLGKHLPIAG